MHTRFGPRDDLACTCELEVATAAHDLRNRLGSALCELRQLRLQVGRQAVRHQLDANWTHGFRVSWACGKPTTCSTSSPACWPMRSSTAALTVQWLSNSTRAGEDALISVADRGIGIPAADPPRIFEPFFRGRNAEAIAPGLGLGLTTAQLLVERYGGSLDAVSVERVGTTLRARLPLAWSDVTPSRCCADHVRRPTPRRCQVLTPQSG
jgi:hypothetical protein